MPWVGSERLETYLKVTQCFKKTQCFETSNVHLPLQVKTNFTQWGMQ